MYSVAESKRVLPSAQVAIAKLKPQAKKIVKPLMSSNVRRNSLTTTTSQKSFSTGMLPERFRPAAAGLVGGGGATLVLHPLDLLKTRQAVNCNSSDAKLRAKYAGVFGAAKAAAKDAGGVFRGLYAGVGANVGLSAASWGIYFAAYGSIKQNMLGTKKNLNAYEQIVAASAAGAVTTAVVNPLSVVKTRMVMGMNSGEYSNVAKALHHLLAKEGISGMYKGLVPNLLNVSHGAIQFVIYEQIKEKFIMTNGRKGKPTTVETLSACAVSKLAAALVTYPCQNVRACQQAALKAGDAFTARQIMKRSGVSGLFKGLTPYLLHVVPNVCLVFMAYEAIAAM